MRFSVRSLLMVVCAVALFLGISIPLYRLWFPDAYAHVQVYKTRMANSVGANGMIEIELRRSDGTFESYYDLLSVPGELDRVTISGTPRRVYGLKLDLEPTQPITLGMRKRHAQKTKFLDAHVNVDDLGFSEYVLGKGMIVKPCGASRFRLTIGKSQEQLLRLHPEDIQP
ncbi:hypothetical protein ETAA8_62160 [Anatilimnocola aggregata]|uniref:Uncharacterized protein n=1 Tax=Anatilimnocola aggregata TaxID=2528021 RepID=A0A517YLH7_9BACT|nr:hypothetical protein [Anatilimnocola aggregata]QDU31063.1 hypothetical protein ETAA8_62160 [Anatilimnocola aggregata]